MFRSAEDAFYRWCDETPKGWATIKWSLATVLGLGTCELAARMVKMSGLLNFLAG